MQDLQKAVQAEKIGTTYFSFGSINVPQAVEGLRVEKN